MIQRLFPGGKTKAFNISYDDGVIQDIRFVEMLNRYGLKGTFNLNYGLMHQNFTWQHECGMTVRRIPEQQVRAVYDGHEVASHSYSHPYFDSASETEILKELGSDKFFLEKLFEKSHIPVKTVLDLVSGKTVPEKELTVKPKLIRRTSL